MGQLVGAGVEFRIGEVSILKHYCDGIRGPCSLRLE